MLAQAAVMVATSPKSNSTYKAIDEALYDVEHKNTGEAPMHLRNAVTKGMKVWVMESDINMPMITRAILLMTWNICLRKCGVLIIITLLLTGMKQK